MDQSLVAVRILDPYESEFLELRKPVLDGASASMKFFLQSAVPLPACVGTEVVEISEEVFLAIVQKPEVLASNPIWQSIFFPSLRHNRCSFNSFILLFWVE